MIDERMQKAINEQINKELYSAYLYLSMQAYFEAEDWSGFASWMNRQAKEEQEHAMKLFNYLIERGGTIKLEALDTPKQNWERVKEVFEDSLEHEQYVTSSINSLMDLAIELKDYASVSFLQWYVDEQVEEEASVGQIVTKLSRIGEKSSALWRFDNELSKAK